MSNRKLSHDESLNFVNFKKKLDSVLHQCRKTEYKKINEKRRNKKLTKSLDKSLDRLSYGNNSGYHSTFFVRNNSTFFKDNKKISFSDNHPIDLMKNEQNINEISEEKEPEIKEKTKENGYVVEYMNENNSLSLDINEFMENNDKEKFYENLKINGNEESNIQKLKEIIYKLQLRDAVHRQKIIKLQNNNELLAKNHEKLQLDNLKLTEVNKQENKISKNLAISLENEKKKVLSLEKKLKKLDPIETAKLMEKLHEKNEDLSKENKKLEEMVKQLLLNREISRIRKLYPTIIENIPLTSNYKLNQYLKKEEYNNNSDKKNKEYINENSFNEEKSLKNSLVENNAEPKNYKVKNVCLDLKEILKGL